MLVTFVSSLSIWIRPTKHNKAFSTGFRHFIFLSERSIANRDWRDTFSRALLYSFDIAEVAKYFVMEVMGVIPIKALMLKALLFWYALRWKIFCHGGHAFESHPSLNFKGYLLWYSLRCKIFVMEVMGLNPIKAWILKDFFFDFRYVFLYRRQLIWIVCSI